MPFRKLPLPPGVEGEVYLHSMPGRVTNFQDDVAEIAQRRIATVVRLTSDRETERKSPEYWDAIASRTIAWRDLRFEIADYGIPRDHDSFARLMNRLADRLAKGERILVHCAAGIGRTGTVACALLVRLGADLEAATRAVAAAGSYAEDEGQRRFLRAFADGLAG